MVDRVSALNYATVGGKRQWQDENLSSGVSGTELAATWHNGMQESVIGVVESVGLAPSDADNTQLTQAIQRLSSSAVISLTASATLTAASPGLVLVNAAAGNLVVTLPAAAALAGTGFGVGAVNTLRLRIARIDTSGNTATITHAGTDTLAPGSQTTYSLAVGEIIDIVSDGVSAWYQLSSNLAGKRWAVFTASATWTAPAWCSQIEYEVVAGGGGGAGNTTSQASGGGGAGGAAMGTVAVVPGTSFSITVGGGGAGGPLGGNAGSLGGISSFDTIASATGGVASYVSGSVSPGAPGGHGSGGTINTFGGMGTDGEVGGTTFGGRGGGSIYGGAPRDVSGANGFTGQAYGAGGGGVYGTAAYNGGNGAPGIVKLRF